MLTLACKKNTDAKSPTSYSWLEAWNVCVATRVQAAQDTALALVKYQCIVYQLFATQDLAVALKYDNLFRQASARTKYHTLSLGSLEEDLVVWCVTTSPFTPGSRPLPSLTWQLLPHRPGDPHLSWCGSPGEEMCLKCKGEGTHPALTLHQWMCVWCLCVHQCLSVCVCVCNVF